MRLRPSPGGYPLPARGTGWGPLTERDKELPIAAALVRWQGQDAGHVVSIWRLLLLRGGGGGSSGGSAPAPAGPLPHLPLPSVLHQHLREVADNVGPLPVHLGQDVEDEGLHVKVQCLVVQEKLGQQAQVLTVNLWRGAETT